MRSVVYRFEKAVDQQKKTRLQKLGKEKIATAKMLLTIYAEAKMYLPFASHPMLMNLFKKLDIHSLQFDHHLDRIGGTRMAHHISKEYHRLFLTYLTKTDRPMALLLGKKKVSWPCLLTIIYVTNV